MTTACEALRQGVPALTLSEATQAGRAAASVLAAAGLAGLVAADEAGYVRVAAELAGDVGRLAGLRVGLRERVAGSALCDASGSARGAESAYRTMRRRHGAGEPPGPLTVASDAPA